MKRILAALLITGLYSCNAQPSGNSVAVAFYNVENLFDTVDDPETWDDDFTPKGSYRYTDRIYRQKLHNIATVIHDINPTIIGLAEVENATVLKDLIAQPELTGYKYAWFDSPDPRGIDVALLYRSESFKVEQANHRAVIHPGLKTRDVLYVSGELDGEAIHLLVNHWPSRREGVKKSMPKRAAAARVNKTIVDSLLKADARNKIFIMGDMNDNPDDESITNVLQARAEKMNKKGYLYNPWASLYNSGQGTSVYHKQWDHFDQIIISGGVADGNGWHLKSIDIFDEDYIRNSNYDDGYPLRSFRGRNWSNGYSDHLPVVMYLER